MSEIVINNVAQAVIAIAGAIVLYKSGKKVRAKVRTRRQIKKKV